MKKQNVPTILSSDKNEDDTIPVQNKITPFIIDASIANNVSTKDEEVPIKVVPIEETDASNGEKMLQDVVSIKVKPIEEIDALIKEKNQIELFCGDSLNNTSVHQEDATMNKKEILTTRRSQKKRKHTNQQPLKERKK